MRSVVHRVATGFDCVADRGGCMFSAHLMQPGTPPNAGGGASVRFHHRGASSHHKIGAAEVQLVLCSYLCLTTFTGTHEAVGDQDSSSTLTVFPVVDFSRRDSWRHCCCSTSPQWRLQVHHIHFSSLCCLCVWEEFESYMRSCLRSCYVTMRLSSTTWSF